MSWAWEGPGNSKNSYCLNYRPLVWNETGLRQNKNPSYIPTCVNYDHTKVSDDPSTLGEEHVGGVEQSTPKGDFIVRIAIFKTNLLPEIELNGIKMNLSSRLLFYLYFSKIQLILLYLFGYGWNQDPWGELPEANLSIFEHTNPPPPSSPPLKRVIKANPEFDSLCLSRSLPAPSLAVSLSKNLLQLLQESSLFHIAF